jgi:hypothetical protein
MEAMANSDPTRPATHSGGDGAATDYSLQSVLLSGTRSIATINGQALSVGDHVGGARVISIGHQNVVLDVKGRTVELTTGRSPVTRKAQWYLTER